MTIQSLATETANLGKVPQYIAVVYARKDGAIGVFYNVTVRFVSYLQHDEALRDQAIKAANREGYEVHHVVSVREREV